MRKKGLLFSITTLLLFLSIFALTLAYLERNKEFKSAVTASSIADKMRFVEDDVVSNAYSDLLSVRLNRITRGSSVHVIFNRTLLAGDRDYSGVMDNYKRFVEENYSLFSNVKVQLSKFNNNFTILPYNTTFKPNGPSLYLFTMPKGYNPVQSISISIQVEGQLLGACGAPIDEGGTFPLISVTFEYAEGSCTEDRRLEPGQDNDLLGRQFYIDTINPSGSVDVKYGRIGGMSGEGILTVQTSGVLGNITTLDIEYVPVEKRVVIMGGHISITSGRIVKESEIVLAEE